MNNYRLIWRLCLLVLLIAIGKLSYGQQKSTWVLNRVLNADNGLPENSITDLYFDHTTGFLWISTEGGLVNYNGVSCKIFDTRNLPTRLARMGGFQPSTANEVIAFDKSGIGMLIKGNRPDTKHFNDYRSFLSLYWKYQRLLPLGDRNVSSKLDSVSKKTGREDIKKQATKVLFMNDSAAVIILADSIYLIRRDIVRIANPPELANLGELRILFINDTDVVLLNNKCTGLYLDTKKRKAFPVGLAQPFVLNDTSTVYPGNINRAHYLLNGRKLYQLHITKDGIETEMLADLPQVPDHISTITVHPQKNQVYIGTVFNGMYIYHRSFFYTYLCRKPENYSGKKNITNIPVVNNFYASLLVDSSSVLIGYMAGYPKSLVALLNLQNGSFDLPAINLDRAQFEKDRQGNIYVYNEKLLRYSFHSSAGKPHAYNFPCSAFFYDSTYDRITVISDTVLARIEHDTLQTVMYVPGSIASKISCLKRTGNVFIAFGSTAVFSIDEANGRFEKFFDAGGEIVRDVYIDADSLAWITTYGKGIYMYDLKTKKLYQPKPDSREYLLFAHYLAEDGHGNFFIPTNNGLFHINRNALIAACKDSGYTVFNHYYDRTSGLLQNEFNGGSYPSYSKLSNGDLLFSSINGLVRVFTSTIGSPDKYPLFIQSVASPSTTYEFTDNMTFKANERVLTLEVNFAQWEYPSASGLSYTLDDDSTWTFVHAGERKILLTDLSGGEHTLQLRNQFDLEGKKISTLITHFYIGKKYYEQPWFWIAVAIALLALIYIAVTLRNYQLKRQNLELEKKIHKQTLEVRIKNSDLEETLQNLNVAMDHLQRNSQFQQRLIGLLGHDIMVPLRYISQVSKQLITYRNKLSEETVVGAIGEIDNTSIQLLFLGESIIHWIKLQEGDFIPKYTKFNMRLLADELLTLHQPLAADKKNVIKNEVPDNLYCVQEQTILRIIIHNLLLNANKFTSNGEIVIGAMQRNNVVELSVRDSGVGMDETQIATLNNMTPVTSQKGTNNELGWGLGYRFIIDLVKFVKGRINIQSKKGEGTIVTIDLVSKEGIAFDET